MWFITYWSFTQIEQYTLKLYIDRAIHKNKKGKKHKVLGRVYSSSSSTWFPLLIHPFHLSNQKQPISTKVTMTSSTIFSLSPSGDLQSPWSTKTIKSRKPQKPSTHLPTLQLFKHPSQNPLIYSSSFPHNLKLPSLKDPISSTHLHPLPDSADENFTKNLENLATLQRITHGFDSISTPEMNPKRVYIQEPP